MLKRFLLILLTLCLCLSVFACGEEPSSRRARRKDKTLSDESSESGSEVSGDGLTSTEQTPNDFSQTPDVNESEAVQGTDDEISGNGGNNGIVYADYLDDPVDMCGREFYILQRWFGYGKPTIDFQGEVIWEDTEDGTMTSINLAKKKVLDEVQKEYNCKITGEMSTKTAGEIRTMLQDDILAGTAEYDFCFETYYYYYAFAEDGLLTDLNDLGIDFSQAWWDQNAVADLSVCGKLYYALGDINTYDNDGTSVLFFNKDLYERKGGDVQALYDMALAGDWTFEEFKNIVTGFGSDSNGDGVRNEFDTYGLLTETSNLYTHLLAGGYKTVDKDANDEPYFALPYGGYDAVTDAINLYLNTNDVLIADLDKYVNQYEGNDVYEKTIIKAFKEGRGLFYMTSLIHLPYFRDMEDEFGFLPIPKYNASDDSYHHGTATHASSVLFVPVGENSKGEKGKQLGMIIDALGAYSKDYLTPEYYEKQLKRGDAQDPDSAEVLDVVFGSRVFDLGQVFGAKWMTTDLVETLDTNIQSRVEGQKDLIEVSIALTVDKIRGSASDTPSNNNSFTPKSGKFFVSSVTYEGETYEGTYIETLGLGDCYILFNTDGTGKLYTDEENGEHSFEYTDSILIDETGDRISYTYDGTKVTMDQDEITIVFTLRTDDGTSTAAGKLKSYLRNNGDYYEGTYFVEKNFNVEGNEIEVLLMYDPIDDGVSFYSEYDVGSVILLFDENETDQGFMFTYTYDGTEMEAYGYVDMATFDTDTKQIEIYSYENVATSDESFIDLMASYEVALLLVSVDRAFSELGVGISLYDLGFKKV